MELIDSKTLIKKFYKFFDEFKKKEVKKAINEGHPALHISFFEISEFDFELGEQILSNPIELLSIMEETLKQFFETLQDSKRKIKIRLTSLPVTEKLMIRDIRSKHINKLILLEGLVRRKTDVRPRLQYLEYLCTNPSCTYSEQKLKIPQLEDKARTIKTCPKCRSGVEEINKLLLDSQNLILEEIPEQLDNSGDQPKRIGILLQEDLVSPFKDSKTNPGSRVYVIGIVKEVPIPTRTGAESIKYDLIVEGNYIDMTEEDYSDIIISKEEIVQIKKLAAEPDVVKTLVKNTAPSIYGYNKIKEALLLQLFGGSGNTKGDGIKTRATIHMLLLGDPGAAKSQLLKSITSIAPKSMFVSGKSATGAGLCVAPNSKIITNHGSINTIENIVEANLTNPQEYKPGILKQDNLKNIKIQSLSNELKIQSKIPKSIWKLESPKKVFKITLSSGKQIELTGNTSLFTIKNGKTQWKKSTNLKLDDYIATPRTLIQGDKELFSIDLIQSNPHLHDIEDYIKDIINKIKKDKKFTKREIAKKIGVNENNLYHNWVEKESKGKIKLKTLKELIKLLNNKIETENYKKKINKVSLYNGKTHTLPTKINKKVAYLAGLIAGDGDIRYNEETKTYSIRLSNLDENLHEIFQNTLKKEFNLNFDVQEGSEARPKATRTNSKLLGEILINLGIPTSPKSNKIQISTKLSQLPNSILSEYIAGLYDTDGSICLRDTGSNVIELTSCSEDLVKELQIILLRFNIHANIRSKKPTNGKIKGNYTRWILEIKGQDQFKQFFNSIPLKHEKKLAKLKIQTNKNIISNTNIDIIPEVWKEIKKILNSQNYSLKEFDCRKNLSRQGLQKLLMNLEKRLLKEDNNLDEIDKLKEIKKIIFSDIFWEKITNIEIKNTQYEYVYDLTVENSHNFVVDGILVHNTATVVKDENTGGWALEAGAMVLANGGICAIDELDKMSEDDTSTMHEALEQQTISIAKANIRATLKCETTVLAAANPKFGRFDPYSDIMKQIVFPPALVSRFDLIFIIRDIPDKKKDSLIAGHILDAHKDKSVTITDIEPDFLKKYIAHAKVIKPILTKDAIDKIRDFYVSIRNAGGEEEEGDMKSVPITARQLEAIVRLAEAYAKIKLDKIVRVEYAEKAIDMLMYCLEKIGIDPRTGQLDIDKITTGITTSTRNQYKNIQQILDKLEMEKPEIGTEDIINEAKKQNISPKEVDIILSKLKKEGVIFEPRKNVYKKLP